MSKKIMFCAISNISSGNCSEDCSFCTQSSYNKSDIETFKKKPIEQIVKEAQIAKANKALGFCLVTSGRGLNDKKIAFVSQVAKAVKKEVDIMLIACNGIASYEQLKELKKAGIDSYNHNIETSKNLYEQICSTHDWEQRYLTCENVNKTGLMLCCGGIFGLGESKEDRKDYLKSLKALNPFSTPINFFISHPSLKIKAPKLSQPEAIEIIKSVRNTLPNSRVMIAGGREIVFSTNQKAMFEAGVDAIVTGDYLTTKGDKPSKDLELVKSLGYEVESVCHG